MGNRSYLDIKAIGIGVLVDIAGSLITALIFAIVYSIILSQQGHSTTEIESMMTGSSFVYLVSLILGLGCTVLGGFVCARIAKREEVKHSAIMGVGGLVLSLLSTGDPEPVWYLIIGVILTVPMAVVGGYIAYTKNKAIKVNIEIIH